MSGLMYGSGILKSSWKVTTKIEMATTSKTILVLAMAASCMDWEYRAI